MKKGFTIVELIVVIAILGILILLATPFIIGKTEYANIGRIKNDIGAVERIYGAYKTTNEEASFALSTISKDSKVYTKRGLFEGTITDELYDITELSTSKLKGKFLSTEKGEVYYVNDSDSVPEKKYSLEREVEVKYSESFLENPDYKILDYKIPSGRYERGTDSIEYYFVVQALEETSISVRGEFYQRLGTDKYTSEVETARVNFEEGETKTISISHPTKDTDNLGFYDTKLWFSSNKDVEFSSHDNIYLYERDWYYYKARELRQHDRGVIGRVGYLNDANVSITERIDSLDLEYIEPKAEVELQVNDATHENPNHTGNAHTRNPEIYGTYEARIKVPTQKGLISSLFLYGKDEDDNSYEIDIEVLNRNGEWQVWSTIYNETHPNYELGMYIDGFVSGQKYPDAEPGIIFQNKKSFNEFGINPSAEFVNYKIELYENFVAFYVNNTELARWNGKFDMHEMDVMVSTFWTHWLQKEIEPGHVQYAETMEVEWIRKKTEDK